MERINLAQDRDRWQALVNTVMNLATLPQGKSQRYSTVQKAGWVLELVCMSWRREESLGAFV